jgi:CHAT domain-containing protein
MRSDEGGQDLRDREADPTAAVGTLLSLWKVPDVSTAELMIRFFGKLRAGTAQVAALAQTKRELMNSARVKDPVHWAGFVRYGS